MRSLAVLVTLLVAGHAIAPPAASACSLVVPAAFGFVDWPIEDTVLTNVGAAAGVLDVPEGGFTPLANGYGWRGATPVTSPDGRYLAWTIGAEEPGPLTESSGGTDCSVPYGRTFVADLHDPDGEPLVLIEGAARAFAASDRHLAVAHHAHQGAILYEWGNWSLPHPIGPPGEWAELAAGAQHLAFSPDGARLALVTSDPRVVVLDVVTLAPLDWNSTDTSEWFANLGHSGRPVDVTWSPDGARLAVLVVGDLDFTIVYAIDVNATRVRAVEAYRAVEAGTGLAWGPGGLAVALSPPHPWRDEVVALVRVLDAVKLNVTAEARFPGVLSRGLAASPDGTRLAFGTNGGLHVLDANLTLDRMVPTPARHGELPRYVVYHADLESAEDGLGGSTGDPLVRHGRSIPGAGVAAVLGLLILAGLTARARDGA